VAAVPVEVFVGTTAVAAVVVDVDPVPLTLSRGLVVASEAKRMSPPTADAESVPPPPAPQPAKVTAKQPTANPSLRSSIRHLLCEDGDVPGTEMLANRGTDPARRALERGKSHSRRLIRPCGVGGATNGT